MEKSVINLHIGTLVDKISIIALPLDGNNHSVQLDPVQLQRLYQEVESVLIDVLTKLNKQIETSVKPYPHDTPQQESH